MKRIVEFFEDGDGILSSMRLLLIVWGIGTFIIWTTLCIGTHGFVPIPISVLTFIGSLVGGKLVQNVTENKELAPPESKQ